MCVCVCVKQQPFLFSFFLFFFFFCIRTAASRFVQILKILKTGGDDGGGSGGGGVSICLSVGRSVYGRASGCVCLCVPVG